MKPILTHEWGPGGSCSRCGEDLRAVLAEHKQSRDGSLRLGTAIGKVDTQHGGVRAYVIGERDSNQKCEAKK